MSKMIPKSPLSRGRKLLGLAGQMAIAGLGQKIKAWESDAQQLKSKIEMAQQVVKTLSELKGASMKLGQLLSLDLADYLPPEVIGVIENLHHKSSFMEFSEVERILKNELGDKVRDFENIGHYPIAAASIGQVHLAQLHGKKVVIKIQYEGVAESIPSDIKILRSIISKINFFRGTNVDFSSVFDELQTVLEKETDYRNEMNMQKHYAASFKDSNYLIPAVYEEHTTSKVLTQEFISGETLSEWLSRPQEQKNKDKISDLLMKLYLTEFFIHGIVQTDPNPGNFIVRDSSELALLDFGAAKIYPKDFVQNYKSILVASLHGDHEKILELSQRLHFLDPREDQKVQTIYIKMMELLITPFREDTPFDFGNKNFLEESRVLSWELTMNCKYSPPPKDLLFLHRKLVGVFLFIKKLETKMVLKDYWKYVETETK